MCISVIIFYYKIYKNYLINPGYDGRKDVTGYSNLIIKLYDWRIIYET